MTDRLTRAKAWLDTFGTNLAAWPVADEEARALLDLLREEAPDHYREAVALDAALETIRDAPLSPFLTARLMADYDAFAGTAKQRSRGLDWRDMVATLRRSFSMPIAAGLAAACLAGWVCGAWAMEAYAGAADADLVLTALDDLTAPFPGEEA